jgi:hypothetical protein
MKPYNVTNDETEEFEFRKVQAIMGDLSFCVILPKKYALELGISKGDYVKIFRKQDNIIIQRA